LKVILYFLVPTIPIKRRYGTDKAGDKRKRRAVALEGK
jgi:hypothetical protein